MTPDRFVMTETARNIHQRIEIARQTREPLLIKGAAGVGKTAALTEYRRREREAILVTCSPAARTLNAVLDILLNRFDRYHNKRSAAEKSATLLYYLDRCTSCHPVLRDEEHRTMLVVDEVQFLNADAMRELLSFNDQTGVPLVFAGNPYALKRTRANAAAFDQIADRLGFILELDGPTDQDIVDFCIEYDVAREAHAEVTRFGREVTARELVRFLKLAKHLAEGGPLKIQHVREAIFVSRGPKGARELLQRSVA